MTDDHSATGDHEQPLGSVLAIYMTKLLAGTELQAYPRTYAYRGQNDASWKLQSAAVRRLESSDQLDEAQTSATLEEQTVRYHRHQLLGPFRSRGYDIVDGRRQTDMECLSTLQHQGAATALLDFSYSPLVALWFASKNGGGNVDGRVFKVDITTCRTNSDGDAAAAESSLGAILGSLQYPREIMAWRPPSLGGSHQRALAQQSVHLLCWHDPDNGNSVRSRHLSDVVVSALDKQQLLEDLRAVGVTEESLFPDLSGFAATNSAVTRIPLPDSRNLLSQANAAYNQQEFDVAADFYSHYLDVHPDDNEVKLLLANAMVDARHSLEAFDLLVEIEPWIQTDLSNHEKSNFYFNRANAAADVGDHASAIDNYTESLRLHDYRAARFNRGNSFAAIGQYDSAIEDYLACPGYAKALFNAGNTHVARFEFEDAESCYEAAVQMQPEQSSFWQNLDSVRRVLLLIAGRHYDRRTDLRTAGTNAPTVMIFVEDDDLQHDLNLQIFPIAGNAGNQGNTGFRNLPGGQGFDGSAGFAIYVILGRDEQDDESRLD